MSTLVWFAADCLWSLADLLRIGERAFYWAARGVDTAEAAARRIHDWLESP